MSNWVLKMIIKCVLEDNKGNDKDKKSDFEWNFFYSEFVFLKLKNVFMASYHLKKASFEY